MTRKRACSRADVDAAIERMAEAIATQIVEIVLDDFTQRRWASASLQRLDRGRLKRVAAAHGIAFAPRTRSTTLITQILNVQSEPDGCAR